MRGEKKIDYQKIFIYMMIFAWMIGFAVTLNENSEYDVIRFGNAHFHLPKRITENLERTEGENYVFLQSDDYLVLGVGPDCEGVDDAIKEDNKCAIQILCAPKGDITKKELDYMYGGIRFDEQDT